MRERGQRERRRKPCCEGRSRRLSVGTSGVAHKGRGGNNGDKWCVHGVTHAKSRQIRRCIPKEGVECRWHKREEREGE